MNGNPNFPPTALKTRIYGWIVHIFTASGAFVGLLSLVEIHHNRCVNALFLMGIAISIDALDGFLARLINIKATLPRVDGALLDNLVDFFNYVLVPSFFLMTCPELLPSSLRYLCVFIIVLSAAYQFTQVDAKTEDHFFKGFPSYWNIAVFYLFFWQTNAYVNFTILLVFAVLSFVPIKYVYPTRLDYLSHSHFFRVTMVATTWIWGAATFGLMWVYPHSSLILNIISMCYMVFYFGVSIYRTCVPLTHSNSS